MNETTYDYYACSFFTFIVLTSTCVSSSSKLPPSIKISPYSPMTHTPAKTSPSYEVQK